MIYLKTQDFRGMGLEAELEQSTSSTLEAVRLVRELFEKTYRKGILYRATGVILSKIQGDHHRQYSLFDPPARMQSLKRIDQVIDGVNEIYGKHTLHLGSSVWLGRHRRHVTERSDLPERKRKLLKGETFRQRLNIPMWRLAV